MEANDKPFRLEIKSDDSLEIQIAKLLEAIEKNPKEKNGYYRWIGSTYLRAKEYDKAFEYFTIAINTATDTDDKAENYGFMALWYGFQDRELEALPYTLLAAEADPTSHEGWLKLGCAYLEQKDYKKAMEAFARLLALPKEEDAINDWEEMYYESMAGIYSEEKKYDEALSLYINMIKEADDKEAKARIYALISDMYEKSKKYEEAIVNIKKAMKLDPENFSFILMLSELYISLKQYDDALDNYKKLLKLKKSNYEDKKYCEKKYYIYTGELYFEINKFDEAIECYKKNLELYDSPEETHETLALICKVYTHQHQYTEALPYLKKIIKLWPNKYPRAYTSMATYYLIVKEDIENTLNYLQLAAKANYMDDNFIQGNDWEIACVIYGSLGKLYYDKYADKDKAIDYFEKALTCKPDVTLEGNICDNLYDIYLEKGNIEKATEYKERRSSIKKTLSLFTDAWVSPPKKTLENRLQNPKNTKQELESLPYHYSKLPKGAIEKSRYKDKLVYEFENDLLTNPKYKGYFAKYEPFYIRGFINRYVRHKISIVGYPEFYLDVEHGFHEVIRKEETNRLMEYILQKKLFNMQLLWRAEQITIPGIKTSEDFEVWERKIFECPFIENITRTEIKLMQNHVISDDFSDEHYRSLLYWQKYNVLMEQEEQGVFTNMSSWYQLYDDKFNTGDLLLLPDIRGEKEEAYIQKYFKWKRNQPPEIRPPHVPYVKDTLDIILGNEETYTEFMDLFEDDYLCTLHHNWSTIHELKDKTFEEDTFNDAVNKLKGAEVPPIIEGGLPWHEAVIKCAEKYAKQTLAASLDDAFAEYKMKRELNIPITDDNYRNPEMFEKYAKEREERILKGRELSGEPRDFNF